MHPYHDCTVGIYAGNQNAWTTNASKRVEEVRPIITSDPDLLSRLALMHPVPFPTATSIILHPEHDVHEDRAAKETDDEVRKHRSVPGPESWRLSRDENVRADHAVEIAPADDDSDLKGSTESVPLFS